MMQANAMADILKNSIELVDRKLIHTNPRCFLALILSLGLGQLISNFEIPITNDLGSYLVCSYFMVGNQRCCMIF